MAGTLTPAHPPPRLRENILKHKAGRLIACLKNPLMDLHFLKIKSKCLDLTSKTFCYQIPAHSSNLIYSCSPRHNLHSVQTGGSHPEARLHSSPPLTRLFPRLNGPFLDYLSHSSAQLWPPRPTPSCLVSPDGAPPLVLHTLWRHLSPGVRSLSWLWGF